ncbi:MAG: hypothetical protein WCD43_02995 [Candidatus Acidiferrales bacterium]
MRKSGVLTVFFAGFLTLGATAARAAGGANPRAAQYIDWVTSYTNNNSTGAMSTIK